MVAVALNVALFSVISWASLKHFNPSSTSPGNTAIRVATFTASLLLLALTLTGAPISLPQQLAGVSFALLSGGVLYAALKETHHRNLDVAFTNEHPADLVTTGIYRRVRNPLYLSYLLYWVSWIPVSGGHGLAVATALAFAIVYYLAARHEERVLHAGFGQEYARYFGRTGRFVPKVF